MQNLITNGLVGWFFKAAIMNLDVKNGSGHVNIECGTIGGYFIAGSGHVDVQCGSIGFYLNTGHVSIHCGSGVVNAA